MQRRSRLGLIGSFLILAGLTLSLQGAAAPLGSAALMSVTRLRAEDPRFGGFSALEISADGSQITMISDRGTWTQGQILRDGDARITGVDLQPLAALKGTGEAPLARARADSEGLAIAADGTAYVSLEGAARVLRYETLAGSARNLPDHPDFAKFRRNRALEALAIDEAGRLYTLPEDTRAAGADFPLYRFEAGAWSQPFAVPRQGEFLPVGADFGPDGRFYLLERAFYGFGGFAARVRAFELGPKAILSEETVLQTTAGRHDNLEGLAVWQDREGGIRLTMVSDDNHLFYLRNQLVEYRLSPSR